MERELTRAVEDYGRIVAGRVRELMELLTYAYGELRREDEQLGERTEWLKRVRALLDEYSG